MEKEEKASEDRGADAEEWGERKERETKPPMGKNHVSKIGEAERPGDEEQGVIGGESLGQARSNKGAGSRACS